MLYVAPRLLSGSGGVGDVFAGMLLSGRLRTGVAVWALMIVTVAVAITRDREFVVLAGGLPDEAAAQALGQARPRALLAVFDLPFDLAGQRCEVGVTIGYTLAPLDGRAGWTSETLDSREEMPVILVPDSCTAASRAGRQAHNHGTTLRRSLTLRCDHGMRCSW